MSSGRNYFIVLVDNASKEGRDAFTRHFIGNKFIGFWHHLESSWIFADVSGTLTPQSLVSLANTHMPSALVLVIRFDPREYFGAIHKDAHKWLREQMEWPGTVTIGNEQK